MAAFEESEQLSGLAGEIRSSVTSEQFDLSNYTQQRARDLVLAAFSTPLTAPTEMVKFTFVVGGGKLVRSRYADDLPKWLVAALREIGFTDDKSAAETFDSQGTFKQQHDTGQNLKYLIVFPHVACANATKESSAVTTSEPVLDEKSPEYIVSACEVSTFKEIVQAKVASYRQKKKLLKHLQDSQERFQAIEQKLVSGTVLTPQEQTIYDSNTGSDAEKIAYLQAEIKQHVDNQQLSAIEKQELLDTITSNLETVDAEMEAAKAENKPKKIEKLLTKKEAMVTRKQFVEKISPVEYRLKHGDEIEKLYLKLFPLQELEDKGRSMSLTLADLKSLEKKTEIEEAIAGYENASRGWFQEEEDFQVMCATVLKQAKSRKKAGAVKKPTASKGTSGPQKIAAGGRSGSSGSWVTAPITKKAGKPTATVAKKSASSGFAAAFGDSDSD